MHSKRGIDRHGSYIVEAAISLPLFIITVVAMSSIILMYACIEDAGFIAATELRRAACEAITVKTAPLVPLRIEQRVKTHSQVEAMNLRDYGYRVSRWGQDELILLSYRMRLSANNPIGLAASANYDLSGVTRAYVGRLRTVGPMSAEEFEETGDELVCVFPKNGEKFHSDGCTYTIAASMGTPLSHAIRSRYSSCRVCGSRTAEIGAYVYVFPKDGEAYHLPSCETLERNYIHMMKRTARSRGYTPCTKCGG